MMGLEMVAARRRAGAAIRIRCYDALAPRIQAALLLMQDGAQ